MKHSLMNNHPPAELKHFQVLSGNNHHYKRRKITEAFYIKDTVRSFNAKNCNFSFLHQHM